MTFSQQSDQRPLAANAFSRITHSSRRSRTKADHASLSALHAPRSTLSRAFTLLEVMVASGIFFIAMIAILGLVSQTLRNARILRVTRVDAGMIAAQLTLTNKLYEGSESGDFGDYSSGYSWSANDDEVMSNGLHQIQFDVVHSGEQGSHSSMTIYLYRPASPPGRMSGAVGPPIGR